MPQITLLFKKNYLAMIRNTAKGENHTFRNFYIVADGQEQDALRNGALGCEVIISSILYLQNSILEFLNKPKWLSFVHANVVSTEMDMERNGWRQIEELREGAVITWEQKPGADGTPHWHMGFYLGNNKAMSNDSNGTCVPMVHHYTYNGARKIARIWWHPALEE